MSQRKPPELSWSAWTERAIREAQESGQFDDLPGRGKPLDDRGGRYDPDWWAKQLVQREKLSILPPALAIRKRVAGELVRIRKLRREDDVRRALASLNAEIIHTNRTVSEGPATTVAPIDIETFLTNWR